MKFSSWMLLGLSIFGIACSPVLSLRKMGGNKIAYYTAEGGVVIQGNTRSKYGMCVMPPAQAVRQRTGKGSGKVAGKGANSIEVEAGGEGESQHEVTKLYEQSPATIFMQQGLYRVCEMAANGAFDKFKEGAEKLTVTGFDAAEYRTMVKEVMRQSYALVEAEAEAARARQIEALEALAATRTPEDQDDAMRAFEAITGIESRLREALKEIAVANTADGLAPYLDDPEPRIRRAANRKLWRLTDGK